jgi:hypothetical protein
VGGIGDGDEDLQSHSALAKKFAQQGKLNKKSPEQKQQWASVAGGRKDGTHRIAGIRLELDP